MAYVLPDSLTTPVYGEPLEDVFQGVLAGITGLPPALCRPRWQPEPPNLPAFHLDWAAFGITGEEKDTFTHQVQLDALRTQLSRDELLTVLFSFYGPKCQQLCAIFTDGITIAANREALVAVDINLVAMKDSRQLPALMKEKWMKRYDVAGVFRRRVKRIYSGNAIELFAAVDLHNEHYITPIPANQPPSP